MQRSIRYDAMALPPPNWNAAGRAPRSRFQALSSRACLMRRSSCSRLHEMTPRGVIYFSPPRAQAWEKHASMTQEDTGKRGQRPINCDNSHHAHAQRVFTIDLHKMYLGYASSCPSPSTWWNSDPPILAQMHQGYSSRASIFYNHRAWTASPFVPPSSRPMAPSCAPARTMAKSRSPRRSSTTCSADFAYSERRKARFIKVPWFLLLRRQRNFYFILLLFYLLLPIRPIRICTGPAESRRKNKSSFKKKRARSSTSSGEKQNKSAIVS